MWRGIDKRRFPRVNYKCNVIIQKGNRTAVSISTFTENIGVGGVCVVLEEPLEIFSEVEMELFFSDGISPIKCKGSIVWVVKRSALDKTKAVYDTGVEFLDISDIDKAKIETIINDALSKEGK